MDNEAQLSTAVVTAPHDTLLPKALDGCEGFLEAEIGVLGAAIVPPVFSPPALHVADAPEYWGGVASRTTEKFAAVDGPNARRCA